jgi:phage gp37-like protein
MYTIAEIEIAIIDRLTSEIPTLKTCDSLGRFLTNEAGGLALRTPAAYVIYERGDFDHSINGVQDRRMAFNVIVVAKNVRGDEQARHGRGAEIGAYELLDNVRVALSNQACGLDIDPLLPTGEDAIETTKAAAIYGISFKTRCRGVLT